VLWASESDPDPAAAAALPRSLARMPSWVQARPLILPFASSTLCVYERRKERKRCTRRQELWLLRRFITECASIVKSSTQ
jgi:hypothetical protein